MAPLLRAPLSLVCRPSPSGLLRLSAPLFRLSPEEKEELKRDGPTAYKIQDIYKRNRIPEGPTERTYSMFDTEKAPQNYSDLTYCLAFAGGTLWLAFVVYKLTPRKVGVVHYDQMGNMKAPTNLTADGDKIPY